MPEYLIRLLELATGQPTPYDGEYLVAYDPGRDGTSPDGQPMLAHLETTPDPAAAKVYPNFTAVHEELTRVDPRRPVRVDGRPNRPLMAFTTEAARRDAALKDPS